MTEHTEVGGSASSWHSHFLVRAHKKITPQLRAGGPLAVREEVPSDTRARLDNLKVVKTLNLVQDYAQF